MAKPRIFVSSTYYDLKHIRSSLENFIESVGYEPVLSEKGDIAYNPDVPLDESCYRDALSSDIFVLIVGGRYGAEASSGKRSEKKEFFDRYDSITKMEYENASKADVPVYILIESSVYNEYHTYIRNKDNKKINYAHVDSENIFVLIEDILSKPKNNPVYHFERSSQIEAWLREQWAGLFREMLKSKSQQRQLAALEEQILDLKSVNNTLKSYLEELVKKANPAESEKIIQREDKRLEESRRNSSLGTNNFLKFVRRSTDDLSSEVILNAVKTSSSFDEFIDNIRNLADEKSAKYIEETLKDHPSAKRDFNELRENLGVRPIKFRS